MATATAQGGAQAAGNRHEEREGNLLSLKPKKGKIKERNQEKNNKRLFVACLKRRRFDALEDPRVLPWVNPEPAQESGQPVLTTPDDCHVARPWSYDLLTSIRTL